jgi:hypothetical protein
MTVVVPLDKLLSHAVKIKSDVLMGNLGVIVKVTYMYFPLQEILSVAVPRIL